MAKAQPLASDVLEEIRESDAAVGEENYRYFPAVYTHRAQLLAHIAALEEISASRDEIVKQLDVLLNGEDGAAQIPSIGAIFIQLRRWMAEGRVITDERLRQLHVQAITTNGMLD